MDIDNRFTQHRVDPGSIAERVRDILHHAGTELDKVVEDSPTLTTMVQYLEKILHIGLNAPETQKEAPTPDAPADTGQDETSSGTQSDTPGTDTQNPAPQG